jgi:hypothetical protein
MHITAGLDLHHAGEKRKQEATASESESAPKETIED